MSTEQMIIAAIVLIGVAGVAYQVMAYLKGKIKLELARSSYSPGDVIKGRFSLQAKKPIEGNRLLVRLVGKEVTRRRDSDGKTRSHSREIYRDEQVIEGAKVYPPGYNERFSFELTAPGARQNVADSPLGQTLGSVSRVLSGERRHLEWRLIVRLDAKGIDISQSRKIHINLGSVF